MVAYLESNSLLSKMQSGFRSGYSTQTALLRVVGDLRRAVEDGHVAIIVLFDFKCAFDTLDHTVLLRRLRALGFTADALRFVHSYLGGREQAVADSSGPASAFMPSTSGVPQGSSPAPILQHSIAAYLTQHVVTGLVVMAKHLWHAENHLNAAVAQVREALLRLGLATADQKTEVLLLTSRKRMESITITVGDCYIESAPHIRYLGVHIDARLRFDVHLAKVCEKATNVAGALSRIMPRTGGPRSSRRKLYANVVDSVLLYGAPIWSSATETQAYWCQAESIHRRACLRIISGRPHLSHEATYVLASIPPLALLADERTRLYHRRHDDAGRDDERQETLRRWQVKWEQSTKGRWTHRLIPHIKGWVERRHGEMSYHLTQLLTGHGYFKHHSQRYDNNASARCPVCPDATENVEHVFFHCTRFEREREEAQMRLSERIEPENIVRFMLRDLAGCKGTAQLRRDVVNAELKEIQDHASNCILNDDAINIGIFRQALRYVMRTDHRPPRDIYDTYALIALSAVGSRPLTGNAHTISARPAATGMTAMLAGLLDLQALSKSSEPLQNTPMSAWLRSSQMLVSGNGDAAALTRRKSGGNHKKDSGGSSNGQGCLDPFSAGVLHRWPRREDGQAGGPHPGPCRLRQIEDETCDPAAEILFLPHPGLLGSEEDHEVLQGTLLAGGRGGRLHSVLEEEQATRSIAARGHCDGEARHWTRIRTNTTSTATTTPYAARKPSGRERSTRRHEALQAEEVERGPQPLRPRQRRVCLRPDAVVVKATGTTTYADILRRLYAESAIQGTVGRAVQSIRRSASGAMVLQLRKGVQNASALGTELDGVLEDAATASALSHKTPLEIREIRTALCQQLGAANLDPDAVRSLRKAYAGTQTAVIDLPDELSAKAIKLGHLRVGWVSCRVRERAEASRCFRGWEFDHLAARCVGPDPSKLCYRCGQDGHRAKACENASVCLLCHGPDASGHATISPSCPMAK
ncbi:unnamed protein product [Trichogramma brassicae]|uniref:CCHC-type domain-containing protein n=1 Tax=Trichogramma brassicae TaxID=86971 RepID=A0A6H5IWC8_9HYME|nr:unnamed protein product [Trichogramma brassicae]